MSVRHTMPQIPTVSNYAAQTARLLYAKYSPNLFRRMNVTEQETWVERQLAPLGLPAEEYQGIRQAFRDLMRDDAAPGDTAKMNPIHANIIRERINIPPRIILTYRTEAYFLLSLPNSCRIEATLSGIPARTTSSTRHAPISPYVLDHLRKVIRNGRATGYIYGDC